MRSPKRTGEYRIEDQMKSLGNIVVLRDAFEDLLLSLTLPQPAIMQLAGDVKLSSGKGKQIGWTRAPTKECLPINYTVDSFKRTRAPK